ncbi:hypothetical protein ATSB10_35160 [Dyella thiooxydans]|uniref:Uncharacterized protein n=1 Tax=Dyella thiooxydans TaxID=445710 RepID=A0A160N4T0_9GAMM|nr:hypothetical protein ATSB10_35160 [Dyella thiooxydans]
MAIGNGFHGVSRGRRGRGGPRLTATLRRVMPDQSRRTGVPAAGRDAGPLAAGATDWPDCSRPSREIPTRMDHGTRAWHRHRAGTGPGAAIGAAVLPRRGGR